MEKPEGAADMDKDLDDSSDDNEGDIDHASTVMVGDDVQTQEPADCNTNTEEPAEASSVVPKGPPKNLGEVI